MKISVVFHNLQSSDITRDIVIERVEAIEARFPDLAGSQVRVTLSMHNSPTQAGPDVFRVKVQCLGGRYKGVILEREGMNLYIALADVVDRLLERLNRAGDRARVKSRRQAREAAEVASRDTNGRFENGDEPDEASALRAFGR